jgi:hypothetical protein
VAAGGDLTGTFPNPQLGTGAVGEDEIASSAVTTAKLDLGAVTGEKLAGGSVSLTKLGFTAVDGVTFSNTTIQGDDCIRSAFGASFPVGSLVLQRVVSGSLPAGVFLPAYTVRNASAVEVILCNADASETAPFTAEIALRVLQ